MTEVNKRDIMRRKYLWRILLVIVATGILIFGGVWQYSTRRNDTGLSHRPVAKARGKWRIAYYQGGDYIDYAENLRALAAALAERGWMPGLDIPTFDDPEDTASIWKFLAERADSAYLEFVADAFWSAEWDDDTRVSVREAAIERLANGGDIDLAIAMGTWAGQDLVNDAHAVPTMALTSSDPIQAGILNSAEDSGYDHVLVEVDPERYRRQIRLFHDVVGFERLGVAYEDSPDGRVYANVADLEQVAAERSFTLVRCHAREDDANETQSLRELKTCYREIAPQIDALWIGTHTAEQPKFMPGILKPMFEHRVPTWAQTGPMAVKRGVLISIQPTDFEAAGRWYAAIMGRIFNGARPRTLNQVFEMPERIVLNRETARRIGFEVPKGVLSIADEVYDTIEGEGE
jgi:ABC-type uncharacterized transport system substrate-binding protein